MPNCCRKAVFCKVQGTQRECGHLTKTHEKCLLFASVGKSIGFNEC